MEVSVETKVCKKCGLEKDIDEFNLSQGRVCLSCIAKRSHDYYWANRVEILISRNKDRQLRKKRIAKRPEGVYYLKIALLVYCTPIVINEELLKVEEKKCYCGKRLTMTEALFGNYCITHSIGQTQNINNLSVFPKIFIQLT